MNGAITRFGGLTLGATLVALLFVPAESAWAHARWRIDSPVIAPRTLSPGLKTSPCGGAARTNTAKTFTPGQMIEVGWEETVNHPGSFRIAFSPADDLGFDNNVLYTVNDTLGAETPMPHYYKATITLPLKTCEACTLQLIQVMTENTPPSYYYSCADIKIVADTSGGGTPPPPPPPAVPTDIKTFAQLLVDDFATADVNADGKLSYAEVQSVFPGVTIAQFNDLDGTKDGQLSKADLDVIINPPPPPSSNSGSSSTGGSTGAASTETKTEKTTAGSLDWTLLLLLAAYGLLLRNRRRAPRMRGALAHFEMTPQPFDVEQR